MTELCVYLADGIVSTLEPAHTYYVRVMEGTRTGPAIQVFLPAEVVKVTNISEKMSDKNTCNYRGKSYKIGAEWYDECVYFCACTEGGKAECATIQCPTDFGLEILDPNCVDWETVPADFVPKAPNCCPQVQSKLSSIDQNCIYGSQYLRVLENIFLEKVFLANINEYPTSLDTLQKKEA